MRISPTAVRYIKLGKGNKWVESSLANNRLEFGHGDASPELLDNHDWTGVEALYRGMGKDPGNVTNRVREIREFVSLPADTLFITFALGKMWWAFSEPTITHLGADGATHGIRSRPVIGAWRSTDLKGRPLFIEELSSALTKTAGYRMTLCEVEAAEYAIRRINAEDEPVAVEAETLKSDLQRVAERLVANLHHENLELLTELIFTSSGWRRLSIVGGGQRDVDLILMQVATGERACVQVKSGASAGDYREHLSWFDQTDYDRSFFICANPKGMKQTLSSDPQKHLWLRPEIAERALAAGLLDWLITHTR